MSLLLLRRNLRYNVSAQGETATPSHLSEYIPRHADVVEGMLAPENPVSILIELANTPPPGMDLGTAIELGLPGKIRAVLNRHCKGKYGVSKKFCFGMLDHRARKFESPWKTIELWRRRCFGSTVRDRESKRRLKI